MLISLRSLKFLFRVKPTAVIHVGAHEAEEAQKYDKYFSTKVIWIEAQDALVERLKFKFEGTNHQVIKAAVWDVAGLALTFRNTSNSQSSSLFDLGTHAKNYPSIKVVNEVAVITSTLDQIIPSNFNADFINLDIQGAELHALKGFENKLPHLKWIYSEVNKEEVYKGCAVVLEMDEYLIRYNFHRIETRWHLTRGWGDAIYIKSDNRLHVRFFKILGMLHATSWNLKELLKLLFRHLLRSERLKA